MAGHKFHHTVLREYDIRGTVGQTLSALDAHAIGRAFGTLVVREGKGPKVVCVGYDGRLSSPELEAGLVRGLTESGVDVVRIGLGPTPMLYFSVFHLKAGGGIMVTGSHNPKDQNGFKFMFGTHSFFGEDITRLGKLASAGDYVSGAGTAKEVRVNEAYVDTLAAALPKGISLGTVAWDPGNGAAGEVLQALVRKLPGKHVLINEKIDGHFPAHHPDPTVAENLVQLQDLVKANKAVVGIGLDGDGDRIGVVDDQTGILWADMLLALLAREVLAARPGAQVIADVKSSSVLFDEITRLGGKPLMWKTGHALIKSKMAELNAPLAGELSGHIFFADRYFGYDDALYAAIRLLSLLGTAGKPLSRIRSELPGLVNTPELRFFCAEERKFAVVDEVRDRLKAKGAKVSDIDGVRVTTADGWWLLRASNTQAALIARAEAKDQPALVRLRMEVSRELGLSGVKLPD